MNIILFSGGIDSTIGLWLLEEGTELDWQPVYFDLNSRYAWKELAHINVINLAARRLGFPEVQVISDLIDVSVQLEIEADYVPQRNTLLCAASQAVYGDAIERIALCSVADDVYRDNDGSFHQAMSNLLTVTSGHPVQVFTPLREGNINGDYGHRMLTKNEAVERYLELGGDARDLRAAVSCYHAGEVHCGRCKACERYDKAMEILEDHIEANA